MSDGVVLLHGIMRTRRSMTRIARFLDANGYRTLNCHYRSTRLSIGEAAAFVEPRIAAFAESVAGRTHFVTYSMGGLVARAVLRRRRPRNLGRVVMLAPPNGGSEVADFMSRYRIYARLCGPAGLQLGTDFPDAATSVRRRRLRARDHSGRSFARSVLVLAARQAQRRESLDRKHPGSRP